MSVLKTTVLTQDVLPMCVEEISEHEKMKTILKYVFTHRTLMFMSRYLKGNVRAIG